MSIIEKAVDKLSTHEHPPAEKNNDEETGARQSSIEASAQMETQQADSPNQSHASPGYSEGVGTALGGDQVDIPGEVDISFRDLRLEGILSPEGGRSKTDEEYRMIKRPLILRAFSGGNSVSGYPNTIMITSALSGEGKTFTAMNLAISMAMEINTTVLLVDSDLAKPNLSRLTRVDDRPGFTECLKDESLDIGQFLLKTDVPSLSILPAGQRHSRATELLASNSMRARIQELASRYPDRVILFDSPPLLATSEATVLAGQVGQLAMVVEYGATPQFLVKEALGMLHSQESVSLILNKTRDDFLTRHVGGYYYGYGKGYGYGAYSER